jgi:hypothetical protein
MRTRRPPMVVRATIRTVWFLSVAGTFGPGPGSGGWGANCCAVAHVVTQCSFGLDGGFSAAAPTTKHAISKLAVANLAKLLMIA